jgi:hypothetical protein
MIATGDIIPIVIALAVACPISWTTAEGRHVLRCLAGLVPGRSGRPELVT